jgi:Zn-dependent protease/CBS domain-containing protein
MANHSEARGSVTMASGSDAPEGEGRRVASITGRGFRLCRLFGIAIVVDWSLIIIFTLITVHLGLAVFPRWHPEWTTPFVWGMALGTALLFFASVLAHELSHALVARIYDVPVRQITLFIFGGMAHMEEEPSSPKAEFWISVVGPFTSIAIGVIATLGGLAIANVPAEAFEEDPAAALASLGPAATLLLWLGPINLILGIFNMVPGFPLDGGRVLRAILWWRMKNVVRATQWAARAGQWFAFTLMALGVLSFFAGDLIGGLWLLLIGWFLNNAARMSYEQLVMRRVLEGVAVTRLMSRDVASVPPDLSVDALVHEVLMGTDQQAFPVIGGRGLEGLVCLEDVRKVARDAWPQVKVSEIMTPASNLTTVGPDADGQRAMEALMRRDVNQVPVMDRGKFVGLVRRRDLLRWLTLHPAEA